MGGPQVPHRAGDHRGDGDHRLPTGGMGRGMGTKGSPQGDGDHRPHRGMGTAGSPQVLLPKLIWDGYLPAISPSVR